MFSFHFYAANLHKIFELYAKNYKKVKTIPYFSFFCSGLQDERTFEDIPTSAGPWKLCGPPGLVLRAEAERLRVLCKQSEQVRAGEQEGSGIDDIHRFTITDIQRIASPIYYETNVITVKTTEAKLIKNRNKTFGNRLYLKNPTYYVGDLSNADVTHDTEGMIVNNVYVNNKAHPQTLFPRYNACSRHHTPPDLMTLILVTIPLYLLYEVSIRVVHWVER